MHHRGISTEKMFGKPSLCNKITAACTCAFVSVFKTAPKSLYAYLFQRQPEHDLYLSNYRHKKILEILEQLSVDIAVCQEMINTLSPNSNPVLIKHREITKRKQARITQSLESATKSA